MESKYFDRVFGHKTEGTPEALDRLVDEKSVEWIDGYEVEKTEREKNIIKFAAHAVAEYMKLYGRDTMPQLKMSHIHVLGEGSTGKMGKKIKGGGMNPLYRYVIADRSNSEKRFAVRIFHELFHRQAFSSAQVMSDKTVEYRRSGIDAKNFSENKATFALAEEAIVHHFTVKFYEEHVQNNPVFSDDDDMEGMTSLSRKPEYDKFMSMIRNLVSRQDELTEEEVLDLFFRAYINGHLLPVARLMNKTFGKGTFKRFSTY